MSDNHSARSNSGKGQYDGRKFKFAGKVTRGLRGASRVQLAAPNGLSVSKCPFIDLPNCRVDHFGEGVTADEMELFAWVRPEVQVEVAFNEWTRAGCAAACRTGDIRLNKKPRPRQACTVLRWG